MDYQLVKGDILISEKDGSEWKVAKTCRSKEFDGEILICIAYAYGVISRPLSPEELAEMKLIPKEVKINKQMELPEIKSKKENKR